ncbi:MAG: pyridoxamine 5'-phosphate oxidase [Polyangiaceae bacterium]|nr:pyridoxamine 5'-phosphate oxidase [Polyangiaceae bacterium]
MIDVPPPSDAPGPDPLAIFAMWLREAAERGACTPDAFALATATLDGRPSVRMVLYKGLVDGALRLVTNSASRKGQEIASNPSAAVVFYWPELGRQVRMEGRVERASASESDEYFASRDRSSQLGAWASAQSQPIATRTELEAAFEGARARFEGRPVERPPHWGVLCLVPSRVELWISGAHRLHDRFLYERSGDSWRVTRLAP